MIILLLLSCGLGVATSEWRASRPRTKLLIMSAIALLPGAVGLISFGNSLAAPSAA